MKQQGFTLVEVMVVIAIIAIILSIASLNFKNFKDKADTEKQTRELHSDITNARLNALQNKQRIALMLGPQRYIYKTYSSDSEPPSDGTEVRTVSYRNEVRQLTGTGTLVPLNITADRIEFDSRGFTSSDITLVVTPITHSGALDCIAVQTARTSIGRMENAACRKQ